MGTLRVRSRDVLGTFAERPEDETGTFAGRNRDAYGTFKKTLWGPIANVRYRIERLWRDVRITVTNKYSHMLHSLEAEGLLDLSVVEELFCVHYTFLPRLQADLDTFAEVTRWTVRTSAIRTVLNQYECIIKALAEMAVSQSDAASKAQGLYDTFQQGNVVFGLLCALEITGELEVLNMSLQSTIQTIDGMLSAVACVKDSFSKKRNSEIFQALYTKATSMCETLHLTPIAAPRVRIPPQRFTDDGVKDSVNVRDIKHFDPKNTTDFSSTQTYWILRKGRFATGQILFMKETCEEIEQFLATGKRIRVPKLLDKSPPENSTSERKEAKDNAVDSTEGKR
ncbi:zinc finger MYM-type 1-like protein [Labeo rohita]|uniref:Zinc finger MYM-type 1-like protein n=1 Tax=Labeo rohita TaxID=84645 RepID=A0A498NYM3_LABRO|nr:zinc finger MYM-type 1-like protein [Labeo rohita]